MNTKIKHEGFTLIELMVTIALVAILLSIAVPSFRELITSNRVVVEANTLMASLNLARATAAKRNQPVTVCKSADGSTCTAAGNWEQGRILFNDLNMDGVVDGPNEAVIEGYTSLPTGYTLRSTVQFSNRITFLPQGVAIGVGALDDDSSFRVCSPDAIDETDDAKARQISINITGRTQSQKGLDPGVDCP